MTKISKKKLPIGKIQLNQGQIEGLPANPRKYTDKDVQDLAASLKETPELTQTRIPIVVPFEDDFVVLGGNRRLEASLLNEETTLECFVMEGLSIEKMKEIVIKDNGSFGQWDMAMLEADWKDTPLQNWGIGLKNWGDSGLPDELKDKDLNPDDLPEEEGEGSCAYQRVIITFKESQREALEKLLGHPVEKVIYNIAELI